MRSLAQRGGVLVCLGLSLFLVLSARAGEPEALKDATASLEKRDYTSALKVLDETLSTSPGSAELLGLRAQVHVLRSYEWETRADADRAIADATAALERRPTMAEARATLGLALGLRREFERAIAECDRAVKDGPNSALPYRFRGLVRELNNQPEMAIADCTNAIRQEPKQPWGYIDRSRLFLSLCQGTSAKEDAERAVELAPESPFAWDALLAVHQFHHESAKALADADKIAQLAPVSTLACLARISVLEWGKKIDEVKRLAEQAVALAPGNAETLRSRANVYLWIGECDMAIADAKQVLRLDPGSVSARLLLANLYTMKDLSRARTYAAEAMTLAPRSPEPCEAMADILDASGNQAGALEHLQTALQLNPRTPSALYSRAIIHVEKERYDDAIADLNRALELTPGVADYLAFRSACLSKIGEHARSRADFEAAVKADEYLAYWYRSFARSLLNDAEGSRADNDYLLRLSPRDAFLLCARAEYHETIRKDPKAALADYDRAVLAAPGSSFCLLQRARFHAAQENLDKALQDLQAAVRIDPSYTEALHLLSAVAQLKDRWSESLNASDDATQLTPNAIDAIATRGLLRALARLSSTEEDAEADELHKFLRLTLVREFELPGGTREGLRGLIVSKDARRVVALTGDVTILDTLTGELIVTLPIPVPEQVVAALSSDGRWLLLGDRQCGRLYFCDLLTGIIRARWQGPTEGLSALAFSPDGTKAVAGGTRGLIQVLDLASGKVLHTLEGANPVTTLLHSPDGQLLVSGHQAEEGTGALRFWDAHTGSLIDRLAGTWLQTWSAPVGMAFLADGRLLVTSATGVLRAIGPKGAVESWHLSVVSSRCCVYSAASDRVTTLGGTGEGSVYLRTFDPGQPGEGGQMAKVATGGSWKIPAAMALSLGVSPDGRRAIVASPEGIRVYSLPLTHEGAIADLTRAERLDPKWAIPLYYRGLCHFAEANHAQAKKDFTRAIGRDPKLTEAYFFRAKVYTEAGNQKEALSDLNKAIELDPSSADAWLERGLIHLARRNYREAKRDFDKASEHDAELRKPITGK